MKRTFRFGVQVIVLLSLMLVLVTASGCNFLPVEEEELAPPLMQPAKIEYKTEPAQRGTLIQQLRLSGSFQPEVQLSLSFEDQGGRLKEKHVRLGQEVKAGDLIAELDSGTVGFNIELQEIEIEKSKLNISQLRENKAGYYAIRRAQLDLEQQELRLANLQRQLAATQIVAPFDGEITYIISTSIGEYINAYQIVAKVADTRQLVLVTTNDKASELPVGAEVVIEFQKEELTGEVIGNPSTLFNDPNEYLRKAAVIKVKGELPAKATLGSDARIVYVQDKREDVLILPRRQINLMSGRRYVNVLEDGVRVEKDVEIGLMTDTEAEIIKGIDEGDLVIVN
ncbi:MAG: biotin/lipoyl-binding protein [Eubacteriales bacterium]|nr:biotin/lipoyl-binding protein [Eubacteriales bacterium]